MVHESPMTLKVPGRAVGLPALPRVLALRGHAEASAAEDPFLPHDYVRPAAAFDLSASARAAEGGAVEKPVQVRPGQVIALELADGVVVFTSPERLKKTLMAVVPQAIDPKDGSLRLDALNDRGAAARRCIGEAVAHLILRVTTLDVGAVDDAILTAARAKTLEWLREKGEETLAHYAELGVSWLGTKALMWAIERRLPRAPGLYRWADANGEAAESFGAGDSRLEADARQGSLLVFIHGTGSSTEGSFSELRTVSREYWRPFQACFGERIYAFEHRTLSESPIENALQLARVLPDRARLCLVTHSRGGLVGDVLCLDRLDGADRRWIDTYAVDEVALGCAEGSERERLRKELAAAYGEQRTHLRELATLLRRKQFVIERYVRVACPARGTRLASGHFDVFLSGLLSLIGLVPVLAGSPLYSAFKRVVLEIAKNRTAPNLVPGIEAMLPESPMGRLLARASPQAATSLAVIAGDIDGGGLLKRLGVLFTDNAFFAGHDNDLVVDTDSMYAGVARPGAARALFERGPDVSHFRYFANDDSRGALRRWLIEPDLDRIDVFTPLPGLEAERRAPKGMRRGAAVRPAPGGKPRRPVVVVLPGIMGSHLQRHRKDRIWFNFDELLAGGLAKLRYGKPAIGAETLFGLFYGKLCDFLAHSHRVEPFPYDWRRPVDELADALAARLRPLLKETHEVRQPLRLLAHGMGGLVVRALIHKHSELWNALMTRDGARFIMLGTPNHGTHWMVETLIGKSDAIRALGRMDLTHGLQGILDLIATFPGVLQLLPRPGFADTGGSQKDDYFRPDVWAEFKDGMRDFWFGDGVAATPSARALAEGGWLWRQDGGAPALPAAFQRKAFYVFGCASHTPCGITNVGGRWKMLGTPYGDGTVTWDSGRIEGLPAANQLWMPVEHGALADTEEYFESIETLLAAGAPGLLMPHAPAARGEKAAEALLCEAGAPAYSSPPDLAAGLIGCRPRVRPRARPLPTLHVQVCAMDLRLTTRPILVGHYEQDPIAGAEALIDRELVEGALTMRYHLGLYAGALGTATVVLPTRSDPQRRRRSYRGAVVAGLGPYDGTLSVGTLTQAVRTAALRYLLHVLDTGAAGPMADRSAGVPLASLLLGYNSSANLTIGDAVTALVRGVVEANHTFAVSARSPIRIHDLQIIEVFIDTAISATYALQEVARALNDAPKRLCRVEADPWLHQGEGLRQRLEDERTAGYWPRIVVTDADRSLDGGPPEGWADRRPSEGGVEASERADGDAELDPGPGAGAKARERLRPARRSRRPAIGERLHFLFLGQRARAEAVVQPRQPGLVERLVVQQLHLCRYQPDFSRTLFQLLVPPDFKDATRGLDRLVMVLDGYTANLPWELMLADEAPLAVQTAVVRQLSSTRFRPRVRQTAERRAYVVGNPSSRGFAEAFLSAAGDPLPLPSAEEEANTVAEVLTQYRYDVVTAIGADQEAVSVLNRLYQHPYRVLHIAGHGVLDASSRDGRLRSGVILSHGLLMTAAEIGAMDGVPDLVFLNCCHLGQIDRAPSAFNRLAASVARELIEMGVRAVVAAGWAVEDLAAQLFAERFYRGLLGDRLPFGDAVFSARRAVWERFPTSMTWGAYQAYGDPGWRLESRNGESNPPSGAAPRRQPVAPEELIASLEHIRLDLRRTERALTAVERQQCARDIEQRLHRVPDPRWLKRPDVCMALGRLYGDLGGDYLSTARVYLQEASEKKARGRARPAGWRRR